MPPAKLNGEDRLTMREWSSINGAVVRQRSVRQETTMAKAGTLPEACYHEDLLPADGASHEQIDEHDYQRVQQYHAEVYEEPLEYDTDTSNDEEEDGGIQSRTKLVARRTFFSVVL